MDASELRFEAPDEGLWANDRVHFFRPETVIAAGLRSRAFDGNELSADRYGVLTARPDRASINRFAYSRARVLVPRPEGDDATARAAWDAAVEVHPVASRRLQAAERVFTDRIWRDDVHNWDRQRKPEAMSRTRELAATLVGDLDDSALLTHLRVCIDHLGDTLSLHHEFNGTWQVPLGDYLAHAGEWTGLGPPALIATLEGASPSSTGSVPELQALALHLAEDERAVALLSSAAAPGAVLEDLQRHEGPVGEAARSYVYTVGYRVIAGFDAMDEYALEHPVGLVEAIRRAIEGADAPGDGAAAIEEVRSAVPAAHRDEFDELLAEARLTFRIKDERGVFANTPVSGLVRRAVVEAGRRLSARGQLVGTEHATEATPEELEVLLGGAGDDRLAEELADRHAFRSTYTSNDAPQTLGTPHEVAPPPEWLPAAARRVARAGAATQAAIRVSDHGAASDASSETVVRGSGASGGTFRGPARLVLNPGDIYRVQPGDVLVSIATNPGYSAVMNICGAIVTDAGGPLSHAAIIARELGLPAVVGTGTATTSIPDGAMVTVDGGAGTVTVVG